MTDTELQKKIMRRVRRVYVLKKATSRTACKLYMLTAIFLALQPFVSFVQVLRNAPRVLDPTYYYHFGMGAVMHTERIVQLALVLVAGIVVWMIVDGVRKLTSTSSPLKIKRTTI